MKCPFCESEDSIQISGGSYISRDYEKVSHNTIETGTFGYNSGKYLCLKCGIFFEKMDQKTLDRYNEEKQYFK